MEEVHKLGGAYLDIEDYLVDASDEDIVEEIADDGIMIVSDGNINLLIPLHINHNGNFRGRKTSSRIFPSTSESAIWARTASLSVTRTQSRSREIRCAGFSQRPALMSSCAF